MRLRFISCVLVLVLILSLFTRPSFPSVVNPFSMMTNIEHNNKHDCTKHNSREHPGSRVSHTHVSKNSKGMYNEQDHLRFGRVADAKPWNQVKKC